MPWPRITAGWNCSWPAENCNAAARRSSMTSQPPEIFCWQAKVTDAAWLSVADDLRAHELFALMRVSRCSLRLATGSLLKEPKRRESNSSTPMS